MGFTKLFDSIIHSTIWREDTHVRIVWVTMMAMADQNGDVMASVPGLADAARVTLEECERALGKLQEPDKYSRSKTLDGRRIVEIDGGWSLVNHGKYRELQSKEDRREKAAARKRRQREKDCHAKCHTESVTGRDGHAVSHPERDSHKMSRMSRQAEAEAEADLDPPLGSPPQPKQEPKRTTRRRPSRSLPANWSPSTKHREVAASKGVDVEAEAEAMRDWAKSGDHRKVDWDAAFAGWLRRARPARRPHCEPPPNGTGGLRAADLLPGLLQEIDLDESGEIPF